MGFVMQENKKKYRDCQRKSLIIEAGKYNSLSEDYFEIQRTTIYITWWNKCGINLRAESSVSTMPDII